MNSFIMAHKRKKSESSGGSGSLSDLVALGILKKPVSEYTNEDINNEEYSKVLIPYNDPTGKILLNNGCIEFEVVGVNHHKDITNENTPTITLMAKNIIRYAAFDAHEPDNEPEFARKLLGSNRWKYSNIRQWLNSSGAAGSWFTKQHMYDAAPTTSNVSGEVGAYADAPGFLVGFISDVLQHFTDITNTTALCNADGGGSETTVDKVFLPSYTEMFDSNINGIKEGSHLSKFNDNTLRIKNDSYWTRSPDNYTQRNWCDIR